mgnify:CR=1 FL=1
MAICRGLSCDARRHPHPAISRQAAGATGTIGAALAAKATPEQLAATAAALRKRLGQGVAVEAVTGDLPPEEREQRVAALGADSVVHVWVRG